MKKKIKSDVKIYSAMEYWFVIKHIYIYFWALRATKKNDGEMIHRKM